MLRYCTRRTIYNPHKIVKIGRQLFMAQGPVPYKGAHWRDPRVDAGAAADFAAWKTGTTGSLRHFCHRRPLRRWRSFLINRGTVFSRSAVCGCQHERTRTFRIHVQQGSTKCGIIFDSRPRFAWSLFQVLIQSTIALRVFSYRLACWR